MVDQRVRLTTEVGEDGREHATASMAETGCDDDLLYISPRQAIPIIFVPGIMGTPLLATGKNRSLVNKLDGKWSWFPDSLPWLGISFSSGGFNRLNPAQKKILLDPDQTKVPRNMGEANFSGLDLEKCILPKTEMEKRGWGTVILGKNGYGEILNFLEAELKTIYTRGEKRPTLKGTLLAFQSELESITGYEALSSDSLRNASAWSYPVFACGYNWLRSNEESADDLANYIQFVLGDCRTRLKLQCSHVILVTHSMGGLVARRCAQKAPNNILGVVHGVQPAIGAGTAYRRVRAGWEDFAGRLAVGENSNEVTPIFAAPGPLQLLPNQLYGNHWLTVRWGSKNGPMLMKLPEANNPYQEIYSKSSSWWRLMDPRLIDPRATSIEEIRNSWNKYLANLSSAENFHTALGTYYFAPTYAHFGVDKVHPAWNKVEWILEGFRNSDGNFSPRIIENTTKTLQLVSDNRSNYITLINSITAGKIAYQPLQGPAIIGADYSGDAYRASMSSQDDTGDGTVPTHSAAAVTDHVKFSARLKGLDHGLSYNSRSARAITLHSIISIANEAQNLC